jgi:ABC-type multidrug transport system permease subunit
MVYTRYILMKSQAKRGGYVLQNSQPYTTKPPEAPVISVKQWMLMMLIMVIPIVNIVMMFVWAFSDGNPTKQNYFKASLLWAAIVFVLYILVFVIFLGALFSTSP